MTKNKKIKVAFIKFGGLATGGTEKWLQTVAANLPKKEFDVDYFYCDSAPYIGSDWVHPDTDPSRLEYMKAKKVNLIKFKVAAKNVSMSTHDWVGTNFWDLFDEKDYDVVVTGRAGHSEYPFYMITSTPIVEFVTLPGMSDKQPNIAKTFHISQFQADTWVQSGGDPRRVEVMPLFSEIPSITAKTDLRKKLGINSKQFVFGMHQRPDDGIYSSIPLEMYSKIESENTAYVLMGGSQKYRTQAKELEIKNFYALDAVGDYTKISKFLSTLDVFAHGRADGETFSLAIAEAMSHCLPIISHVAPAMGHVETIGDGGIVAGSDSEYCNEMIKLMEDKDYYLKRSAKAYDRFNTVLSLESNIEKLVKILKNVIEEKEKIARLENLSPDDFWNAEWK